MIVSKEFNMRIDKIQKIRQVAGENIIISQSSGVSDMTRVAALNESALEIYNQLKDCEFTIEDVVKVLLNTYDVDESTARTDAAKWVEQMRKEGLIVD